MDTRLSYAVVTPVRDERDNLPRLASSIIAQHRPPQAWLIIDTGSTDGTAEVAPAVAGRVPFASFFAIEGPAMPTRGGPVVRAFHAGVAALDSTIDVIIKLDADVSFEPEYFDRVLQGFEADPTLGIASGICTEFEGGAWRPRFGARSHVWGQSRAYRRECLREVLPLEEREGWDDIDAIKAQLRGWRVRTFSQVPFRHHRVVGFRDGATRVRWSRQGRTAHYMGYRFSYLLARALWRAREDRAALAMLPAYVSATLRRDPQCPDDGVRAYLRSTQRARRLPRRLRESLGRCSETP